MCVLAVLCTASCHDDRDDYTTIASIDLILPDGGTIETMQYSLHMMNLNTRNTVTLAGSTHAGSIVVGDLLRGAYSISVEGVVRYSVAGAEGSRVAQFRALSDYVSIVELNKNVISLEMILMD